MFPATRSNQITYGYFCTLGGLSNKSVCQITRRNGAHIYHTYHLLTTM